MKRRALIIHCGNTSSGELDGPFYDNLNYKNFLLSNLGGNWYKEEVLSLDNPDSFLVSAAITEFLNEADYTFIIFSGHGFINTSDNKQYVELSNKSIPIINLRTTAKRQTLIIDACRGYYCEPSAILKGFSETYDHFAGDIYSTRTIFDNAVSRADQGWTILYSASKNETALDTGDGGAYLLSLLKIAEVWKEVDKHNNILPIDITHIHAKKYLLDNFETTQNATMNNEKRKVYFPFAVKFTRLHG